MRFGRSSRSRIGATTHTIYLAMTWRKTVTNSFALDYEKFVFTDYDNFILGGFDTFIPKRTIYFLQKDK